MSARHSDGFIDQKKVVFREGTGHCFEPSDPRAGPFFLKREFWMIFSKKAIFASSAWKFGKCCPVVDREVWRSSPEVEI